MQTSFTPEFLQTHHGQRVNTILRSCVHCGFCNATCPTYQLTGDELDGPRGRIYLIKNFFENKDSSDISLKHLDRCLTCLACETTCPSGVKYGDLIDIGREHIEKSIQRPAINKLKRHLIIYVFSKPHLVSFVLLLARLIKPILPLKLAKKIPDRPKQTMACSLVTAQRKMLTIKGCVQTSVAPQINAATSQVLQRSKIQLDESDSNCCGALAFHLTETETAKKQICKNIDEWHEKLQNNHEFILVNSSGCSNFIKQYSTIMQSDEHYANKAKFVSERCKDLTEIIPEINIKQVATLGKTVAFHSPCTLQHGQKILGNVETLLQQAGYRVVLPTDAHICCGSAGSYSLLETEFSTQLLRNKVAHLENQNPDMIATANIGCLLHLQSESKLPVKHWIELLAASST